MKRRWKVLIALGILAGLLAASMVMSFRVRPANELEAYKKYLRDHGEKLELSQVQPPPVAPESNAVNEVQTAFGMIEATAAKNPEAMQMVAPGKALIGWSQPTRAGTTSPIPGRSLPPLWNPTDQPSNCCMPF